MFCFEDRPREHWFRKDPGFDAELRERFGEAVEAALAGALDHWADRPDGALALVMLLDQVPGNIFRDSPRAFAGDAQALAVARRILAEGWDAEYRSAGRTFAYLPLEHSEELADQEECVRRFEAWGGDPGGLEFARRHRDIIARFGRFPHRNAVLGRESTPEETGFLKQPGSTF